jgi:uncharacterized membrane protein
MKCLLVFTNEYSSSAPYFNRIKTYIKSTIMKNKFLIALAITVTGLVILNACRHEILFPGTGGTTLSSNPCSPDSVYFVNDILPLITSNCAMSGCHDNVSHKEGVRLTNYSQIMSLVSAGNASGSTLYKEIIKTSGSRMPPPPMPAFTTAQKALVQKWINQGAKNNSCSGRCDTATFTFALAIKPLMDGKCVGCHNPGNLGGNIDLSTYAGVKTVALNGKLYGSIAQQAGFSPMPKNGTKFTDCEITQVQKWIANGSLNN